MKTLTEHTEIVETYINGDKSDVVDYLARLTPSETFTFLMVANQCGVNSIDLFPLFELTEDAQLNTVQKKMVVEVLQYVAKKNLIKDNGDEVLLLSALYKLDNLNH